MMRGIGVDIVDVSRIAEKIGKEKGFRELVFSGSEIDYCSGKTHQFEHYAARFAGKEAFLKALGTGWAGDMALNEIEILPDEIGKPSVKLYGKTATVLKSGETVWISLSHTSSTAIAMVIIEFTK